MHRKLILFIFVIFLLSMGINFFRTKTVVQVAGIDAVEITALAFRDGQTGELTVTNSQDKIREFVDYLAQFRVRRSITQSSSVGYTWYVDIYSGSEVAARITFVGLLNINEVNYVLAGTKPDTAYIANFVSTLPTATVQLGVSGLIDGLLATAGSEKDQATWKAQHFILRDNGLFEVQVKADYISVEEQMVDYLASFMLFAVKSTHYEETWSRDPEGAGIDWWSHTLLTEIIPVMFEGSADTGLARYSGTYQIPVYFEDNSTAEMIIRKTLDSFDVQISWVRAFSGPDGDIYYQWLQSSTPLTLNINETYEQVIGNFLIYRPQSSSNANPVDGFYYHEWFKSQLNQ